MKNLEIVIIGVGGQGTLLASRILGALAMNEGSDVKVSEVHGMSQRGGSVITYVRIGEAVHSPMVGLGTADYVLAFEQLEAMRALPYLKKGGTLIANDQRILPMPVISGAVSYPKDPLQTLREKCDVVALDALAIAQEAGEPRAVNLVLMGVLVRLLGEDAQPWRRAIESCVPEKFLKVNLRAFEMGHAREGR